MSIYYKAVKDDRTSLMTIGEYSYKYHIGARIKCMSWTRGIFLFKEKTDLELWLDEMFYEKERRKIKIIEILTLAPVMRPRYIYAWPKSLKDLYARRAKTHHRAPSKAVCCKHIEVLT